MTVKEPEYTNVNSYISRRPAAKHGGKESNQPLDPTTLISLGVAQNLHSLLVDTMSHSPLPGPPRSRSTPASPAPNRNSDSSFGPLSHVLHAPLSAHHGPPQTRHALALERLKLNGALLLIQCFLGYVGLWAALVNLLSYALSTTGAVVFCTFVLTRRARVWPAKSVP